MASTHLTLRGQAAVMLQDSTTSGQASSNALFLTAELDYVMADCLRTFSNYAPYKTKESFTIESRTGYATATTTSALVDTSEDQFLSGDVGKIVYNKTDNTWAVVTAYVSETQLTLSKDIMASGDSYEIYNKNCRNSKEIYIGDITDRLEDPVAVEYPIGTRHNVEVFNDILTLGVDTVDDSKVLSSGSQQPETEVLVHFLKRHRLSQLTTLTGAVNLSAGYSAGDTSMVLDALQTSGTIEADQEFTIANVRGTYRVTTAATISTAAATISFYPGLESAVADNTVVTFKLSTLNATMEPLFVDFWAARAALSKARDYIGAIRVGGASTPAELKAWGEHKLALTLIALQSLSRPEPYETYPRS